MCGEGDHTEQPYSRQGLTKALLANDLVVAKQSNMAQLSELLFCNDQTTQAWYLTIEFEAQVLSNAASNT